MEYVTEIEIQLPLQEVIELFDNPVNIPKWQPGLVNCELLSGEKGKPGAKLKFSYKISKRSIEIVETIEKRHLPEVSSSIYESKGVWNHVTNRFKAINGQSTKWEVENIFKCKGSMKILSTLMPHAFKKQTMSMMQDFKSFAENTQKQIN